jgi:anti-sigma factor RsiW
MDQFEENFPAHEECALWEAMCPEAVDGTLTPVERQAFDRHVAGCVRCAAEFEQAQRGAAWLHMLKGHTPEPPASLMERILAETTGNLAPARTEAAEPTYAPAIPAFIPDPADFWTPPAAQPQPSWLSSLWARTLDTFRIENATASFQPRFAMTAAMAFFSVALSLNLLGVHLRDLGSLSLRPGSLSRTVADAGASLERNFQNRRFVYQVESRVSELRHDDEPVPGFSDNQPAPAPAAATPQQTPPEGRAKP